MRRGDDGSRGHSLRRWALIVLIAVALHALLFVGVRQSFFEIFRAPTPQEGASSPRASFAPAIVAIDIDVEGEEPATTEILQPVPPSPQPPAPTRGRGDAQVDAIDVRDIVGEAQSPLPAEPSGGAAAVPPRPIEITWPETRDLGHCLGLRIAVRIHVGAEGEILAVEPGEHGHPSDCVRAALDAARRVRFEPGRVDGRPAAMWTELLIEFRHRSR
jgi:hypothetical protein